ncbi:hypothetical protein AG4045_007429 [Apium graveolens]|uniref:Uncharacterized protein n=1 Tax=Apium graveolens TaxID=4045 RepID=A0A6L5B9L2_APIGR|nr:hypothetical protein AG4045_007429 [Apium graveolens]
MSSKSDKVIPKSLMPREVSPCYFVYALLMDRFPILFIKEGLHFVYHAPQSTVD